LRFALENGSPQQKEEAEERIRQIVHEDPTSAYAQILAERHGLWENEATRPTMFVTAFERAMRTGHVDALVDIEERYPRWSALTLVARALLGDVRAVVRMKEFVTTEMEPDVPAIEVIRQAIKPIVVHATETDQIVHNLDAYRSKIVLALWDANESTIGEYALAA
jgi:hypothetical protein